MRPWRLARAIHGPGKLLLDLATAITLRGDCLADIGVVRAKEQVGAVLVSAALAEVVDHGAGRARLDPHTLQRLALRVRGPPCQPDQVVLLDGAQPHPLPHEHLAPEPPRVLAGLRGGHRATPGPHRPHAGSLRTPATIGGPDATSGDHPRPTRGVLAGTRPRSLRTSAGVGVGAAKRWRGRRARTVPPARPKRCETGM